VQQKSVYLEVGHAVLGLAPALSPLCGYCSIRLVVNLVSEQDEWEVLGVSRAGLHQELVSPRLLQLAHGDRNSYTITPIAKWTYQ